MPTLSYILCGTPRTGSTLLCTLLESTTIAGRPQSYFRKPDEQTMATEWGIIDAADGTFDYADYVRAAIAQGSSANGVFAVRIMWGSLVPLLDKLGKIYPQEQGSDLELLTRAFGPTRFIYLLRDDVLAQAISLYRAEQTNIWHLDDGESAPVVEEPVFNFDEIRALTEIIHEHNAAWRDWFRSVDVVPHAIRYEELDADPIGVTRGVLDFLDLELPPAQRIVARNRRLADELTRQWVDRYQTEASKRR